jgi:hypothetical protein
VWPFVHTRRRADLAIHKMDTLGLNGPAGGSIAALGLRVVLGVISAFGPDRLASPARGSTRSHAGNSNGRVAAASSLLQAGRTKRPVCRRSTGRFVSSWTDDRWVALGHFGEFVRDEPMHLAVDRAGDGPPACTAVAPRQPRTAPQATTRAGHPRAPATTASAAIEPRIAADNARHTVRAARGNGDVQVAFCWPSSLWTRLPSHFPSLVTVGDGEPTFPLQRHRSRHRGPVDRPVTFVAS